MTRNVSTVFRRNAEALFADEVDLCFLTISHPLLLTPVRVVWDALNFVYGGNTYIGFPFSISILSDTDQPPSAQLSIQNVDQSIGEAVRGLTTPPRLKIEVLSSTDFDLTVNPRQAISSPAPTVVYSADRLFLTNVTVDAMNITATIVGWDYLQRVWPGKRAAQGDFPGLFV